VKITLICIGKNNSKSFDSEINKYFKRINNYLNFSIKYFNNSKLLDKKVNDLRKKNCLIYLLDEKGTEYNSLKFSYFIQKKINSGINNLTFIIGDYSGFSKLITNNFNNKISLSKMTFSHQMIRLFFCEQLYRSFTIINNHPYHNN
tara:strand:- start:471 stop:908 length:438 start_codon:yes stop_codon:yes gene_type:complete